MNASAPILRTSTEFPADWPMRTAASFAPFITSGSRGWAGYYAETGDLFMRITNLDRSSIYPDLSDRQHVALPESEREGLRTGLRLGDILISITADIGIIGYVDEKIPLPAYINQHVACLRLPADQVCSKFVAYFLASAEPQKRFIEMTDVGAKTGINLTTVGKLTFPCPPLHEQQAIAAALSDADGVVAGLERVIAKKRLIKQGAMQDLLTSRRRLPGFSGDWEVKRLGDVARFGKGKGLPKSDVSSAGRYECIHYGSLFREQPAVISAVHTFTTWFGGAVLSDAGDVLMPTSDVTPSGLAVASCISKSDVILGGDILIIKPDAAALNGQFLSSVIRNSKTQIMELVSGTTVFHIYAGDMARFTFGAPSVAEQRAIAAVLSDMDAEIQTLEARLTKARAMKEGMMQNLLTGRVRLV